MISPGALEDAVLTLLTYSSEHATALALRVPADLFTSKINQVIATAALDYIRRYNTPPKGQLEYLLEYELNRGEAGKLLGNQLDSIADQAKDIQASFILEELDRFIELQRTTKALGAALEAATGGDLEEARAQIAKAREGGAQRGSPGISLNNPKQSLSFLDDEWEEGFSSGVHIIDKIGSVPARKTLTLFIAPPSRGKSWWCTAVGKAGIQHHRKVIHITLENSAKMTSRRYLQSLFSLTKKETLEVAVTNFPEGSINTEQITRPSVEAKRDEVTKKLNRWGSRMQLYIKEYPSGYLTLDELNLFLDDFARNGDGDTAGFEPDILIVDYGDLMRLDIGNYRLDIGHTTVGLRGIAGSRNCAVCSPVQGNRDSDSIKTVKRNNAAEDWSRIGTADNVYTYSQTPEEHKLGLARISVEKSRNERDRYMVLISQAYQIGQFALDSVLMQADISTQLDRMTDAN